MLAVGLSLAQEDGGAVIDSGRPTPTEELEERLDKAEQQLDDELRKVEALLRQLKSATDAREDEDPTQEKQPRPPDALLPEAPPLAPVLPVPEPDVRDTDDMAPVIEPVINLEPPLTTGS